MRAIVFDSPNSADDSMTVGPALESGGVHVEINEPWSGDTERGFGNRLEFYLSREQVIQLRDHLNEVINAKT